MPATSSVKIDYRYPVSKGTTEKPNECTYDQTGFVRSFRTLAGTGKQFGIEAKPHNGRTRDERGNLKVTRIELVLSETGHMTGSQAAEYIAVKVPSIFPLIAKFNPVSAIKSSMTLENLHDAWKDVTRHILFMNRDRFQSYQEVEDMILEHYRLSFNQDTSKMHFNGTLFSKIAERVITDLSDMDVDDRGKAHATLLAQIRNNSAEQKQTITSPSLSKNNKTMEPLVKASQWDDVVNQSKRCYISYTPVDKTKKGEHNEYRFATITEGHDVPGRNAKIVGGAKTEYTTYKQVGHYSTLFDRTINDDGIEIISTTKAEVDTSAPKADANGFVARSIKTAERTPLTKEQMALVNRAKAKFGTANSMIKLPKTDHGIYAKAVKAVQQGLLD